MRPPRGASQYFVMGVCPFAAPWPMLPAIYPFLTIPKAVLQLRAF